MGNAHAFPDRLNEANAKKLAGDLWNKPIFESLADGNGTVAKQDVLDSAGEALMAQQGESYELRWNPGRQQRRSQAVVFATNKEYGVFMFEKLKKVGRQPVSKLCVAAYKGDVDEFVSAAEGSDDDTLLVKDSKVHENALHIASRFGSTGIIDYMMTRGVAVASKNKEGKTPLHLASQFGNIECINILLKHGADVDALDKNGRVAADYAVSDYSSEGFVKKNQGNIRSLKQLLRPNKALLYTGAREPPFNDPAGKEIVAVEMCSVTSDIVGISKRSNRSNGSTLDTVVVTSGNASMNGSGVTLPGMVLGN